MKYNREDALKNFLADHPTVVDITEGDIVDEVKAVRSFVNERYKKQREFLNLRDED